VQNKNDSMTNDLMTKNMGIYGYHNFLLIRAFIIIGFQTSSLYNISKMDGFI